MKLKLRYTKLPMPKIKLPKFQSDIESGEFTGYHPEADMKTGMTNPFVYPQMGSDPTAQSTIGSQGLGFKPMAQPTLQFNTASPVQLNQNINRDSGVASAQLNQNISRNPEVANALQTFSQNLQNPAIQDFNQRKFLMGTVRDMKRRIKEGTTDETKEQFKDYKSWVNQTAPFVSAEDKQKMFKTAKGISTGADVLSIISEGANYLNQQKKIKEFDRSMRDRAFDITPTASQEFEGNYDVNSGMFQPYRIFNPNEGQFAEDGGQINNTMKIRITGTPVEQMAYGGQSNYGLDLGRKKVYADMSDGRAASISSSISAVPREMANIEAEGGETVYGDLDSDGGLEHLKIQGKRHTQGGVPLNVPEGSFIFSDTKKMKIKDPEILKYFGLGAKSGGYTPAEIAKRYDINKYKAVMEDPNADQLSKDTAQLMVKNYQGKLSKLALVQEGMKGFPGGIPEVSKSVMPQDMLPEAAFGGYLPIYQGAAGSSTTGPKKIKESEIAAYEAQGFERIPGTNRFKKGKVEIEAVDPTLVPGKPGSKGNATLGRIEPGYKIPSDGPWNTPCGQLKFTLEDMKARPNCYNTFLNKQGFKDASDEEKLKGLDDYKRGRMPKYVPGTPGTPVEATKDTYICTEEQIKAGYVYNPQTNKCEKPKTPEELEVEPEPGIPEVPGDVPGGDTPYKFLRPDKVNMAAAAMFGPNIYMPWSPDLNFRPNQLALQDWQAQTQNVYQGVNTAANTLGNYQPGTAMASNMAFLNAQAADNAAKAIYQTDAGNVDRFNTFSQREGDRKDLVDQYNLKNRVELYDKGTVAKQQYDNAKRQYVNNLAQSYTNAWDNRMKLGMLNAVNNIYKVDPDTGRSYFVKGMGTEGFGAGQSGTGNKTFAQLKADLISKGYSESLAEKKADQMMSGNKVTYTDSDMDGYPNSSRTSVNQQAVNMLGNYLAAFPPQKKRGGQIKTIAEYLRGGFVFDPREY